jgi:PKD domain
MLHGLVDGRALIVAALSAATILTAGATFAASARADAAQVTVVSPGGAQQTLSLDALVGSEDVTARTYELRSGESRSSATVTGFSLAAILDAAGADPFSFSYLQVQRPEGGAVRLSRHQALDAGAFADGPPVVYATATGTGFLRPSGGPEDDNATDSFEAPQGISIVLGKGSPLLVQARASTPRTRPGRPIEFSATVEGGGAGEELIYSWYFDDGDSASGASARHAFAERGSYDVVVGVTTPGDSTGSSDVVTVQVGAPIAGPDRRGGGRNRDANAPDHGAAGDSGQSGGAANPAPSAHLCPHSGKKCALDTELRGDGPSETTSEAQAGEPVSGVLLTGSQTSPRPPKKATAAARTGILDGGEGGGTSLPDAALGLLVTAGLLGLGALAEARGSLSTYRDEKEPQGAAP